MENFVKEISTPADLIKILEDLPENTRIVTDVGASMCSGWGDIKRAEYSSKYNALELIFD